MSQAAQQTVPLFEQLKGCGDPRQSRGWAKGEPDYIARLGLGPQHVPALLDIARRRIDDEEWPEDESAWYAPIHAWRALAQLRAVAAVPLLLEMLDPMDADGDDWHLEEFPDAFALIGPPAFEAVAGYLSDASHSEYARVCGAHALCRIAQVHPHMRDQAVKTLTECLGRYVQNGSDLNSFLISYLVKLGAAGSTELIERAYAARRVDEWIVGDWDTVRRRLGVEGMGLAPEKQARRQVQLPYWPGTGQPGSGEAKRSFKSRDRKKQKQQRKARKRGRGRSR